MEEFCELHFKNISWELIVKLVFLFLFFMEHLQVRNLTNQNKEQVLQ